MTRARDLACAALGWAIAIAVWVAASRLQRSLLSDDFGAEGMPRGLAIALAIASTAIAVRAFLRRAPAAPPDEDALTPLQHARAFGIVALGFGYVLMAPWSGYLPAAFLLIAAATLYYGARPSITLFAVSAAGTFTLWWVFAKMLRISMP